MLRAHGQAVEVEKQLERLEVPELPELQFSSLTFLLMTFLSHLLKDKRRAPQFAIGMTLHSPQTLRRNNTWWLLMVNQSLIPLIAEDL